MTRDKFNELVALWQFRLGLGHWSIDIRYEESDRCEFICVEQSSQYDSAIIIVQPWLLISKRPPRKDVLAVDLTVDFIEKNIVHELLHLCLKGYRSILTDIEMQLHRDVFSVVSNSFERVDEQAVDRLACALVNRFGAKT